MSTDAEFEPYTRASFDALMAAVRHEQGDTSAIDDIDAAFDRLDGVPNIIAIIGGWFGAVAQVHPIPAGASLGLVAVDPRTGKQISPDGRMPKDALLAARLEVAIRNKDYDNAVALWETAADQGLADDVLILMLRSAARQIAHHVPAQETETDD